MTAFERYNKAFFITAACVVGVAVLLNVTLDIHRVFGLCTWNKRYLNVNVRFLQFEHLMKSERSYDAFIVGSSRANFLDTRLASQLSGHHYYSLASAAEQIDRILLKLRWLKDHGYPVKQVILALDFDFMFLADDLPESTLVTKEHPAVSGQPALSFYLPYFIQFDGHNWKKLFKEVVIEKKPVRFAFDPSTGRWSYPDRDEAIARDPQTYVRETFSYEIPYERGKTYRLPVNLARLALLVDFLNREGIPRIVVVNPYHHFAFNNYHNEEYRTWLREVVQICGTVWDFSGLNAVTRDDYLYYESSHFRQPVGDKVLRRVFGEPQGRRQRQEDAFGVLLTRENIDAYLESGRWDIEAERPRE